ncbi:MAG: UDP-N-acetylmuramate--L-alanine ligase, partial [Anaerolineales bacterium]
MKHVHFVGVGGAGLSAIATVLLESGHTVSGSDMQASENTERLAAAGATVTIGHHADNIAGADTVVISSAVPDGNPEVVAAQAAGLPVLKRQQFLSDLMSPQTCVAIAGTHGKTTTTALVAYILNNAGYDPSFIVGGVMANLGTNARHGSGPHFVVEADEYDRMFLGLDPVAAVITNAEHDHPDEYPTHADLAAAFDEFARRVSREGCLVVCADDQTAAAIGAAARERGQRVATYALQAAAEWRAESLQTNGAGGYDFLVMRDDETLGLARSRLPGEHNVANALAALTVLDFLAVPFDAALEGLRGFRGVGRRFEVKGDVAGVTVVDDYAHHPSEIRATLAGARRRYPDRNIWAMFQPHTYSRTKALLLNFAASFDDADHVLVTDIFGSREVDNGSVSANDLVTEMHHADAQYVGALSAAAALLVENLQPGDVL